MPKPTPAGNPGLDDFKAQYDKNVIVPAKIRAGLEKLAKLRPDGTAWKTDQAFIKDFAGVSNTDFALFREEFLPFSVNVGTERQPKYVWFGTKAAAAKAREVKNPL